MSVSVCVGSGVGMFVCWVYGGWLAEVGVWWVGVRGCIESGCVGVDMY